MSLIESYDESDEIVKPEIFTEATKKLPDIAIVCFKKELINEIKKRKDFEIYSSINVCGDSIDIYKTILGKKEIIVYKTLFGIV